MYEGQWSPPSSATLLASWDFTAAELGGIRYLELLPPLVYVGLAHRERLVRCRCLALCDPGELNVGARPSV